MSGSLLDRVCALVSFLKESEISLSSQSGVCVDIVALFTACAADFAQMFKEHSLPCTAAGKEIFHARVRACLCFSLSAFLSTLQTGARPFLNAQQMESSFTFGTTFSRAFQYLAAEAMEDGQLLWKYRPKYHYFLHLLEDLRSSSLNMFFASNFLDEDHMKVMRSVGSSCHPRTSRTKWARRYILKKKCSVRCRAQKPRWTMTAGKSWTACRQCNVACNERMLAFLHFAVMAVV